MANENFGLLLKLILDQAGVSGVKKGMEESAKSVDGVVKSIAELNKEEKALKASYDATSKTLDDAIAKTKSYKDALEKAKKEGWASADSYEKLVKQYEEEEKALSQTLESYKEQIEAIKALKKEKSDLAKFTGMSVKELGNLSKEEYASAKAALEAQRQIDGFNKKLQVTERRVADLRQTSEYINRISQGLFLAGSSVVGSVFLAANQEAQRIKEAGGVVDETTQRWLTSQERIRRSYQRVGRTAEIVFLPTMEKVAALAEKGSKFVERHPELVRAALNTGMVIATVGAVGMLVAKGVRFVADATLIAAQIKYGLSTYMFKTSVDKFVAAQALAKTDIPAGGQGWKAWAGKLSPAGTVGAAGGAGALGLGGSLAMVAIGVVIAKALTVAVDKIFERMGVSQKIADAQATIATTSRRPYPGMIPQARETANANNPAAQAIKKVSDEAESLTDVFKDLEKGIDDLSSTTVQAQKDMEGAKIITQLERDNLEAQKEYGQEQAKIISDSNEAIQKATGDLIQARNRIRANLSSTLSKLAADFAQSNQKADVQYQEERARIAKDGNDEVLRIQKNAQDELRKLTEDFADEEDQLTRERDALGLVKARREFEKNKKEIESDRDDQIKERRKQTAQQLSELRQSYQKERAERLAKYQQDVADAKAQAAQELAESQAAFNLRMAEIQKQKQAELSELARAYNEERRRRVLAAYEQIKDLGGALNAERVMRTRYYAIINAEAAAFMAQYASTLRAIKGTSGTTATSTAFSTVKTGAGAGTYPTRHSGGYTGDGLYMMKRGEFVMTPGTTQAVESLIGSQLSQQAIVNAAMAGGGGRTVNFVDNSRYQADISISTRRAIKQQVDERFDEVLEYIGVKR